VVAPLCYRELLPAGDVSEAKGANPRPANVNFRIAGAF
jgi:hypothetical protein